MNTSPDRNLNPHPRQPLSLVVVASLILVAGAGCRPAPDSAEPVREDDAPYAASAPAEPINLLVIDDPAVGAVVSRQYSARQSGTVKVTERTWSSIVENNFADFSQFDAVIYPARRLGELATRDLISPIESNQQRNSDARKSVLPFDRRELVSWGERVMGVSLGQSLPMMLCRSDVLAACESEVPESWKEFSELAEKIAASGTIGLPERIGVPLADHWAGYMLMARAAPVVREPGKYSTFFDVGDMRPLIDSEPFLRALQGWARDLDPAIAAATPAEVLRQFMAGELAIAMAPVHPELLEEVATPDFEFQLAPLPGAPESGPELSVRTFGGDGRPTRVPLVGATGLVASVVAGRRERVATAFVEWLRDKKISALVAAETPLAGPSHKTHLADAGQWLGPAFSPDHAVAAANLIESAHEGRLCLIVPRIPSADEYLDLLDAAVRAVIADEANPVESLAQVAHRWNELNEEAGRDARRAAYRLSEGMSR